MPGARDDRCPLCEGPLYGWATLPVEPGVPALGATPPEAGVRVIDRCEDCGAGVERGHPIDFERELAAISEPGEGGALAISCPNRASVQAGLSGDGWAPLDLLPGRLALTPRSLVLLAERNGYRIEQVGFPPFGIGHLWMWQTLINALTFHNNLARDVYAGRFRPGRGRARAAFGIDILVTVLAAPFAALVTVPLETISSLLNRGGLISARATPAGPAA